MLLANEPVYQSHHHEVLNDPEVRAVLKTLNQYNTPTERPGIHLDHDQWRIGLRDHPIEGYADEIIRRNRIDEDGGGWPITSNINITAPGAARQYPGTIKFWAKALELIEDRMLKGYFLGPFDAERDLPDWLTQGQAPLFHPIFGKLELKSDGTIKTRLLFNLSDDSNGHSFNDCIPPEEKTVTYITLLDVCRRIIDCDLKWLWCLDALEAYYRVPIQARFIPLMGVQICKLLFFFTCLVMGQATACRLYTEFADAVTWIIANNEEELFKWRTKTQTDAAKNSKESTKPEIDMIMHYIDDFFGGHQQKAMAKKQFEAVKRWWIRLGIPTQDRKCTPPTQVLLYLGFLFNARRRTLGVPAKKLKKYKDALRNIAWHYTPPTRSDSAGNSRKMLVRELQQMVGRLRSLTPVFPYIVPALRAFEEVTSKDTTAPHHRHHRVRITAEMMAGLKIVKAALDDVDQGHMPFSWLLHPRNVGDIEVYTDASTTIGVGGFEDIQNGGFFGGKWSDTKGWGVMKHQPDITYLELLGVVAAAALFGHKWTEKVIKIRCDNAGVCMMVRRKVACFRRRDLNALLLILCRLATKFRFYFWIEHIAGVDNKLADALSRDEWADVAADKASKRLDSAPTDCLAVINKLAKTWTEHAQYVIATRFAAKRVCKCDHDDDRVRRQCNRMHEKRHRLNPRYERPKGNRRARREHLQW